MINLIPQSAKRSLLIEYWVRVVSVWLTVWSIAFFVGASILYPAYVLIGYQIEAYETTAQEASQKVLVYENISTSLVQASVQAKTIIDESSELDFSEFIDLFEGLQGTKIHLSQIGLSRNVTGIAPVKLVGVADDRQSLASFRDKLLAEEHVTEVDLPISNLARDKDIQFSITVTLKNDKI